MDRSLDVLVLGMHFAPETTGNAPYTTGMAQALQCAGHRVRVVAGLPHYPRWEVADGYGGWRTREQFDGIELTRVWHPVPSSPTASRRILMDACYAMNVALHGGARPDVVVAVSPVLLTIASALRWQRRGRTSVGVVTQDIYSRALVETRLTSPRAARLGARMESALLRRADGVVAVHDSFARNLRALGVEDDKITIIKNWSHVQASIVDRRLARERLGWRPDEVIALHAGNMGVKQGLENVIEAGRAAEHAGEKIRFVLLGDGGRRGALEAAAVGIRSVDIIDPLPTGAFEDALAAADVLILNEATSVAEMSVPSKLTTYFAAGRPVVAASHAHSAASVEIERSQGGVRVDPGQPGELMNAALCLARSPEAEAMGRRGQRYALRDLTRERAAEAYDAWVQALADRR